MLVPVPHLHIFTIIDGCYHALSPQLSDTDAALWHDAPTFPHFLFKRSKNPGFLPRLNAQFGQRYTVGATEALSVFQKDQLKQRAARNQLERVVDLQAGKGQPWDLVDRFVSGF